MCDCEPNLAELNPQGSGQESDFPKREVMNQEDPDMWGSRADGEGNKQARRMYLRSLH